MVIWVARVMRSIWWISVVWLAFTAVAIGYCFVQWIIRNKDPLRSETAIVAGWVLICSSPALLGILIAGVVPGSGLSSFKRIGGVILLVVCIAATFLLDYLQARYR